MVFKKRRKGWFAKVKRKLLDSTLWEVTYYHKSTNTKSVIVERYYNCLKYMDNPVLDIEKALIDKLSDYSAYGLFNYARHLQFITNCIKVTYETPKRRKRKRKKEIQERDKLIEELINP